ncbi:TetR/AcrR family transcriptional regulator [Variovorax sp. HJSM1_2]|uniref:TetR/AcrR family transcriptional regulator n=1 Tax=Variovorax sp. HJSM1_2 TaxID=3366263 RepID=UPI003BE1A18A
MTSRKLVSPWAPSADREQVRIDKREAVLRMAAQVFNEKGYMAATLDEVAERLHVTKPTLYYYVKNKDEILFECVRIGLTMMQDAITKAGASGGSALDKLVAAMHQYTEIVTMDFGMCLIRVGEDPLPPESQRKLRRIKAAIDLEFRELIRQGIAEGTIAPCDPKLAAFTLAGALSWIGRWYRPDGAWTPDDIARQCIALLSNGLCVQKTAPLPAKSTPRRKLKAV